MDARTPRGRQGVLPNALEGRRTIVVGLGVTGASVARHLVRTGVAFDAVDARGARELSLPAATRVFADLDTALGSSAQASDEAALADTVLVLSPGIPRASEPVARALSRGARVIGDIELFAAAVDAPVVAVTGSNGKSTVVAWLADALARTGIGAVACGNIGEAALDALVQGAELYVLELSSYQLESTANLAPLVACVLNVSEDHLDRYDSFAHYAATKRQVYHGAKRAVYHADDRETWPDERLGRPLDGRDAGFGIDAVGSGGEHAEVAPAGARWTLAAGPAPSAPPVLMRGDRVLLDTRDLALPGAHNALNALAVLALAEPAIEALRTDRTAEVRAQLIAALGEWRGLPHRTELVAEARGVRWYDDSKGTNVDACRRAIQAMPGPVILIAGGLGKGADFGPLADCAAALKLVLLIGRDAPRLAAVLAPLTEVRNSGTLDAAVSAAAAAAAPGDAVLLSPACASFDQFEDYVARGLAFQGAVRATLAASVGTSRAGGAGP